MRILSFAACCGLCLALAAGCGSQQGAPAEGKLTIAVIPKSMGAEFWENVKAGAEEACQEMDVEMKWEGPLNENELADQNKIIENMVNLHVAGIALAPLNPKAMRGQVENAVKAGIPVVIFDSAVDGDAHTSFVATNNRLSGEIGGQHVSKLVGGKGRVMVMRFIQGTASTEARAEGCLKAFHDAGLDVVADPYGQDATVAGCKKAAANTLESLISGNKLQLDGIFACNDRASLGMLEALKDLRLSGVEVNVKFVGFDFGARLVEALESGDIDALVVQNPRKMGYLAVQTLVRHLHGEKVEPVIDTGVDLATRQRVAEDQELRERIGAKSPASASP